MEYVCMVLCLALGYMLGNRRKPVALEKDEEKERKVREAKEEFEKLMNYSYEDALNSKRGD